MYSAANIEWRFAAEHPEFSDRIRAAKAAGLDAVEFWLWRDKDINAIKNALDETGVRITWMKTITGSFELVSRLGVQTFR